MVKITQNEINVISKYIYDISGISLDEKKAMRPFNRFSRALNYIHENIEKDISVNMLAEISGLGRSRFYEAFRQQTGMTPSDFVMRARCEKAYDMLAHTHASVTAIALDLGFSSSQYFATCFKNFSGMTPSMLRAERKAVKRQKPG